MYMCHQISQRTCVRRTQRPSMARSLAVCASDMISPMLVISCFRVLLDVICVGSRFRCERERWHTNTHTHARTHTHPVMHAKSLTWESDQLVFCLYSGRLSIAIGCALLPLTPPPPLPAPPTVYIYMLVCEDVKGAEWIGCSMIRGRRLKIHRFRLRLWMHMVLSVDQWDARSRPTNERTQRTVGIGERNANTDVPAAAVDGVGVGRRAPSSYIYIHPTHTTYTIYIYAYTYRPHCCCSR